MMAVKGKLGDGSEKMVMTYFKSIFQGMIGRIKENVIMICM